MVEILPISAFKDNYIWAWINPKTQKLWVVDPGDAEPVLKQGVEVEGILLTHHHFDHTGGVAELARRFPDIKIIGSHLSSIPEINTRVKEGDDVVCGPFMLHVIEIPGHTLDHVAFYNNEVLFCGDTLFSGGCGRVFEGTYEQMYQTLSKLMKLPNQVKIYCGHEYTGANLAFGKVVEPSNREIEAKLHEIQGENCTLPSILKEEFRFNPFLRCMEPDIIQAAEKYAGRPLLTPVEVFKVLREWKNQN